MTIHQTIADIQIVEYEDRFAAEVAKMWNKSKEAWGGSVKTEEQIIDQHRSTDNLHTFLAVHNDEVVGYCGLSVYKEDVGSLYIPLLNVRPDFHGKKVGKLLLLHVLQAVINKKWPRLDLYTWAGNTKAVPLYKRCGFFWEDEDSYTHLMNFIPTILNDKLLAPYMAKIDWYKDMLRTMELKPDGRNVDGFTYYDYEWVNTETALKASFEKTGRGLCALETDDFSIELSLKNHELLVGQEHEVTCFIKNKSTTPLLIELSSCPNERVICDFNHRLFVEEEMTITDTFFLTEGPEAEKGKTFPTIAVNIAAGGTMTTFKLGICPKTPVTIMAKPIHYALQEGFEIALDLELENNLTESVQATIMLPESEYLSFKDSTFSLLLKGKEKRFVSIPASILALGFTNEDILVQVKWQGGELTVNKPIALALKGIGERFFGETKDYYHVFNGIYQVNVRKADNVMTAGTNQTGNLPFAMFAPMLGKPYSNELSKKKPEKVETSYEKTSIILTLHYQSTEHPDNSIKLNIQLFAEGLVKRWVLLENKQTSLDIHLQETFYHDWAEVYLPLKGEVVVFKEADMVEPRDIASKDMSSNWYFSQDQSSPVGVYWTQGSKIRMEGWKMHLESQKSRQGNVYSFPPLYMSIGAYRNWREVESAAAGIQASKKEIHKGLELIWNGGNPMLEANTSLSYQFASYRNNALKFDMDLIINNASAHLQDLKVNTPLHLPFEAAAWQAVNKMTIVMKTEIRESYFDNILFYPQGRITKNIINEKGFETYRLHNGILEISAAADYYPGIFSLQVNETEWLDQAFPELIAKSWWNPWAGGMKAGPPDLNDYSMMKESTKLAFVDVWDNFANKWSGIRIDTDINQHSQWRGLSFSQYFVTMPGLPLLAVFVSVHKTAGRKMEKEQWHTNLFLHNNCTLQLADHKLHNRVYTSGAMEQDITLKEDFHVKLQGTEDKLHLLTDRNRISTQYYTNNEIIQLVSMTNCERDNQNRVFTLPSFLYFDKMNVTSSQLDILKSLRFTKL